MHSAYEALSCREPARRSRKHSVDGRDRVARDAARSPLAYELFNTSLVFLTPPRRDVRSRELRRERAARHPPRTATNESLLMSRSPRPGGEGYAVEVSLLKFKPQTLALAAACFVTLFALLGWLGFGDVRQLAASRPVKNHAANHERREAPAAMPNSATSQAAPHTSRADAAEKSVERSAAAAPEPSPAGFAEASAPADAPAPSSSNAAP